MKGNCIFLLGVALAPLLSFADDPCDVMPASLKGSFTVSHKSPASVCQCYFSPTVVHYGATVQLGGPVTNCVAKRPDLNCDWTTLEDIFIGPKALFIGTCQNGIVNLTSYYSIYSISGYYINGTLTVNGSDSSDQFVMNLT